MIVSIVCRFVAVPVCKNILLVGLPQVLVVLLGLLLEQLEPSLQRLILRTVLCALVDCGRASRPPARGHRSCAAGK